MAVRTSRWTPDRGDVNWIDFNPQVGREMGDLHPMLVLSPKAFNDRTSLVIGLPMTTAAYNDTNPFAVRFTGTKGVVSYVLAHQPKSFDWRARGGKAHPWKKVPSEVLEEARETLGQLVDLTG
ncbi:MAG: type II toxin-antitoxin system PemK/MazF family toxin [Variovorax sp.]|nr:MAG: type II toxin-antitoxin system PemK/MazF family toxin [Variovorax sp.]